MNAAAVSAGAFLGLIAISSAFASFRRRRAIMAGEAYPQRVFAGLRWSSSVRVASIAVMLVLITVVTIANANPLVDRLFPTADSASRLEIISAFHEVLAVSVVGLAAVAALTDTVVTFVRAPALRRALMGVFSIGLLGCTTYGGLFVVALAIS